MKTITIKTYSPKGLVVKGATETQAEVIRAELGGSVCTQFNAKLGGWVFSRKREDKIRTIISSMTEDLPGKWGIVAELEAERAKPNPIGGKWAEAEAQSPEERQAENQRQYAGWSDLLRVAEESEIQNAH